MSENNEEGKFENVFGTINFEQNEAQPEVKEQADIQPQIEEQEVFKKVQADNLPTKPSVWSKIRSFLFQEIDLFAPIKVELTPYQQKVEDELNEFLHQEISFKGFIDILKS